MIMVLLYNISIYFYQILVVLASPFSTKAKQFRDGRKHIFDKIKIAIGQNSQPIAWFHCASLGEFEQARPVIERFKTQYPAHKVFLTFFSPSGYEIRKNYAGADWIFYLPLDSSSNAKKFIQLVQPKIAFFTKYEFWYHYLKNLHIHQIPTYSFSAIFRANQVFFKSYGGFYRKFLSYINHFFVQDQNSLDLLKSIGIQNVTIAGDTRFDRVAEICAHKKEIVIAQIFKNNQQTMVIGSSWPQDMEILLPLINSNNIQLKYIIAPHEIHEIEIEALLKKINKKTVKFSNAQLDDCHQYDVLIIDNIGMLSSLYQYGEIAYVGGAFGKGLHNILEPATFGIPVFFGTNYSKFNEAVQLVKAGGAFSISSSEALIVHIDKITHDKNYLDQLAAISKHFVSQNTGGSKMIIDFIG